MNSFDPTTASRAVLIEVMNVLGAFRDKIVLVGGWVPDLLYPNCGQHGLAGCGLGGFARTPWDGTCIRRSCNEW